MRSRTSTSIGTRWTSPSSSEKDDGRASTPTSCSPTKSNPFAGAVLRKRLLVSQYRRTDWDDWLADNDLLEPAAQAERMSFSSSILTWQAALDGLGVAIGQTALLTPAR